MAKSAAIARKRTEQPVQFSKVSYQIQIQRRPSWPPKKPANPAAEVKVRSPFAELDPRFLAWLDSRTSHDKWSPRSQPTAFSQLEGSWRCHRVKLSSSQYGYRILLYQGRYHMSSRLPYRECTNSKKGFSFPSRPRRSADPDNTATDQPLWPSRIGKQEQIVTEKFQRKSTLVPLRTVRLDRVSELRHIFYSFRERKEHTRDKSAWRLRRQGESRSSMCSIARFAFARKPALMSESIDDLLHVYLDCVGLPRQDRNEFAFNVIRIRLLQQTIDAWSRSGNAERRKSVAISMNFSFCQIGKCWLFVAKYGSIMASKIAKGGGVGGGPSLRRALSPWAIRRLILLWASWACSLSRWGSASKRSAMMSLMSSINDARDVGPKYLSLRPLFGFVAKRPRGLAYTASVTRRGDWEAGTSSIGLAWSAGGVVGPVGTIDDSSKGRFSEFRVSSTEDCQSSVKKASGNGAVEMTNLLRDSEGDCSVRL